jgi:hypothetical protein
MVQSEYRLTSKPEETPSEENEMSKFNQIQKTNLAHAALVASFSLTAGLFVCGVSTAQPVKYRDTKIMPAMSHVAILPSALANDFRAPPPVEFSAADDFRAPPPEEFAAADDFRAPALDVTITGSIDRPKNCSRATFLGCRPHQ